MTGVQTCALPIFVQVFVRCVANQSVSSRPYHARHETNAPAVSVMSSNAPLYPCTSAFNPVRLKRSTMYSSSTSQKYSLPLLARNHAIQLLAYEAEEELESSSTARRGEEVSGVRGWRGAEVLLLRLAVAGTSGCVAAWHNASIATRAGALTFPTPSTLLLSARKPPSSQPHHARSTVTYCSCQCYRPQERCSS